MLFIIYIIDNGIEGFHNLIGTFDDLPDNILFMWKFYFLKTLPADKAIRTNLAVHAWDHFVIAGTIMTVKQDYFSHFISIKLVMKA